MELFHELKSRWSSTKVTSFRMFIPCTETISVLYSSSSIISPYLLPSPFPSLSLSSFLSSSSFILPSTCSSITSFLQLPQNNHNNTSHCSYNSLSLLYRPSSHSLFAFFPTGDNSDCIGFITLSLNGNSKLTAQELRTSSAEHTLCNQRILKLLVNPFSGSSKIGYVMACTMYGVQWFSLDFVNEEKAKNPMLDFMGNKIFKSCALVDACWSPHVPEECLALLENGDLFLFDLDVSSNSRFSTSRFTGKRLKVTWRDWSTFGKGGLFGCEYSWHPEVFVVAHSSAVFLLDFRMGQCHVTCLLKIDTATTYTPACKDRFAAFSKAGSNHYCFVVASEYRIVLFDVRKALIPLLQWAHEITNPSCINVFSLSHLGVYPKDDDHLKFGNCIVLGSFWNCEFGVFGYGSEHTESSNMMCALNIPSILSLSGREGGCGSSLLREEIWKESVHENMDWRQTKEIVLGFSILHKDLHAELSEHHGFTLIRLMSSGNIELQRYTPSHDFVETIKEPLKKSSDHSLLFMDSEPEYKFTKRFQYLKLEYLDAYMKDDLDKALFEKIKNPQPKVPCQSDYISSAEFHKYVCGKFKTRSSDVVSGIRSMSSIHEVTLSKIWTQFPADLLLMAFSNNSPEVALDNKKLSLKFLEIPNQSQDPPFVFREPPCRSNKSAQPKTAVVGPILQTPVLLTVNDLRKEQATEFSANSEIENQCNQVLKLFNHGMNLISLHKCFPKTYESPTKDARSEDSVCYDEKFTTFICKTSEKKASRLGAEMDGPEMFDCLSPIELKFDSTVTLGTTNPYPFQILTKHYLEFLQNCEPYQQYLEESNLHNY